MGMPLEIIGPNIFRCFLTGKDGVLSNEFVLAPEGNGETKATLARMVRNSEVEWRDRRR